MERTAIAFGSFGLAFVLATTAALGGWRLTHRPAHAGPAHAGPAHVGLPAPIVAHFGHMRVGGCLADGLNATAAATAAARAAEMAPAPSANVRVLHEVVLEL